jgi:hypothetical protein
MSPSAVSQRGNVVQQETDFFSIIVAILVLAIALGIHNAKIGPDGQFLHYRYLVSYLARDFYLV